MPSPARTAAKHRRRARPAPGMTVAALISRATRELARADLCYGHGTDNPRDEAASLVFHAAGLAHEDAPLAYALPVSAATRKALAALLRRRIAERIPAPYLTGRVWFAGHEIRVDPRVLVPRSPLAEFILAKGAPFMRAGPVRRVLDLGTGSGCIAIAAAHAFASATVDASDVSITALKVARDNVRRHGLSARVRVRRADVFAGLGACRYDLILANPPYVPEAVVDGLPPEYRHEPRGGLAAGADGLTIVRAILQGAAARLREQGLLLVEVGDSQTAVAQAWPRVPFLWLEFVNGGGGVFLLSRETLIEHAAAFGSPSRRARTRIPRVR